MSKSIGIIAGAGPEAGIDLWKKILEANRRHHGDNFRGDIDAPEVLVHSIPELGFAMNLQEHESRLWAALLRAITHMDSQTNLLCIACNVLHTFADRIRALDTTLDLVSIVDVTCDHICSAGINRVGFLSISSVMALEGNSPYAALRDSANIVTAADSAAVDVLIREVKRHGASFPGLRERYDDIVRDLGVDSVILACTELPLLSHPLPGIEQIDATRLLADEVVRRSLQA